MLKLLSHNYVLSDQANDSWAKVFLGSSIGTKVQLVPRLATQHQVAALLADCDCGVFPSRAEGWNLGLLECMSVGLNVIATDYSAHTEFVEPANCRLVHIDETEPPRDRRMALGQRKLGQAGPVPDGADGPSPARSAPAETGGFPAPQRRRDRDRQRVHLAPHGRSRAAGCAVAASETRMMLECLPD